MGIGRKVVSAALLIFFLGSGAFAQYPVFDAQNWLQSYYNFMEACDTVLNTYKMIEQNYQRAQHAIEQAKNFKWEDIKRNSSELPFDFRDEINQAGSQINRQLNNIRRARDALTRNNIRINGHSYSIYGLVANTFHPYSDEVRDGSLGALFDDVYETYQDSINDSVNTLLNGMSDKERMQLYQKTGIQAENYVMATQALTKAREIAIDFLALNVDEGKKAAEETAALQRKAIMNMIFAADENSGHPLTVKDILQMNSMLQTLQMDQLAELTSRFNDAMAYAVYKDMADRQEKQGKERALTELRGEVYSRPIYPDY